jgi:hypothetical protein
MYTARRTGNSASSSTVIPERPRRAILGRESDFVSAGCRPLLTPCNAPSGPYRAREISVATWGAWTLVDIEPSAAKTGAPHGS